MTSMRSSANRIADTSMTSESTPEYVRALTEHEATGASESSYGLVRQFQISEAATTATHITTRFRESVMLAKIRSLPHAERAEHEEFLDTLLDKAEHRRLVREAFEITKRSLARYWGDDDEKPKEDI